jgi:hypothetical protein
MIWTIIVLSGWRTNVDIKNIEGVVCKLVELRDVVDTILDTDCAEDGLMIELDTICSELENIFKED